MMGKVEEEEVEGDTRSWTDSLKAALKLSFILTCYSLSFVALVQWGFWLCRVPTFNKQTEEFTSWVTDKWRGGLGGGLWGDGVVSALVKDGALLVLFGIQHSLLTQRTLEGTWVWTRLHYIYKVDKSLYVLATGVVLQVWIRQWQPVPVVMWSIPRIQEWYAYVHIFAWMIMYGTSLMLDLPDMTGFNQVIVSSPTITQKSPQLQLLYNHQRHMGLVPFMLMLFIHPLMTLDRFLLSIFILGYTYFRWKSELGYEYTVQMKQLKKERLLQ